MTTRRKHDRVQVPQQVTGVSAFWGAEAPRRKPRPHVPNAPPPPPSWKRPPQSEAARLRVAEFEAGRPPLVLDPVEAGGLARIRAAKRADEELRRIPIDVRLDVVRESRDVARELTVDQALVGRKGGRSR